MKDRDNIDRFVREAGLYGKSKNITSDFLKSIDRYDDRLYENKRPSNDLDGFTKDESKLFDSALKE